MAWLGAPWPGWAVKAWLGLDGEADAQAAGGSLRPPHPHHHRRTTTMDDVTGPLVPPFVQEMLATLNGLEAVGGQMAEIAKRLEAENHRLRLAILGGEDAAGFAASLPVESVLQVLDSERREARRRAEATEGTLDMLLEEIEGLIGESRGVTGLHRNGDEAPWSELVAGGQFERLTTIPEAAALLLALGRRPAEATAQGTEG